MSQRSISTIGPTFSWRCWSMPIAALGQSSIHRAMDPFTSQPSTTPGTIAHVSVGRSCCPCCRYAGVSFSLAGDCHADAPHALLAPCSAYPTRTLVTLTRPPGHSTTTSSDLACSRLRERSGSPRSFTFSMLPGMPSYATSVSPIRIPTRL
jgi:hypothetical protein